ncbi:MAG: glycosyltransferase [Desulfovibrionaceae bacterium]|nr:glycosyltransferase [Desulfovibrionaceae bacterium]
MSHGLPDIRQHVMLELRGGATRVAGLLAQGLADMGLACGLSFEVREAQDPGPVLAAADLGPGLDPNVLLHVHSTADWAGLLGGLGPGQRLVVSLHDATLLTGGCAQPLDCPEFGRGCPGPCPRNFEDPAETRRANLGLLKRLDPLLISPSAWLARLAKQALPGCRLTVIPNGVPWPDRPRSKAEARRSMGLDPGARVVLFVAHGGVRAAYKGGGKWPDYWRQIKALAPGALGFAVGGDSADRDGDLFYWPYVGRDRLLQLMAAADALMYPTLADNHSLVILEAMSAGLACVSFEVGGVPEQIRHEENGLLAPPGDHQAIVRAAARVLNDPRLSRTLGRNAFFLGQKRFEARRMVADHLRAYRAECRAG